VRARIARGIRIDTQQRLEPHLEGSFFRGFAHRGVLDALAHIDESARDGPTERRILSLDQHNRPVRVVNEFDDDVGGQCWCRGYGHRWCLRGARDCVRARGFDSTN